MLYREKSGNPCHKQALIFFRVSSFTFREAAAIAILVGQSGSFLGFPVVAILHLTRRKTQTFARFTFLKKTLLFAFKLEGAISVEKNTTDVVHTHLSFSLMILSMP
jgi:hypothetical protein